MVKRRGKKIKGKKVEVISRLAKAIWGSVVQEVVVEMMNLLRGFMAGYNYR